jgi:heme/copper-type cytochrome/quinol oxidase subunit 1
MTLAQKVLRGVSLSITVVGVLFALIALFSWLRAFSFWGNPRPFSTAMLWSFGAVVAFTLGGVVDWLRKRGE